MTTDPQVPATPPMPPVPAGNEARLDALGALGVLDTAPDQGFDDVTDYVAQVCETPIALVSLVDRDRQWFKSAHGFDQTETGLESSVCAYVVISGDFLEIPDLTRDARTRRNPLVTAPGGIRFYAGAPLRLSGGAVVGSLCVLDTRPRVLTDLQRWTLRVMAAQVVNQMELRRAVMQAEVLKKEVDHRVKNSLQSISAQTRIQARKSRNPEVQAALGQVGTRIEMAAALHEQLYTSSDGTEVDLRDFVEKTARILEGTSPAHIRVTTDFAPARIDAARASAIGVILNEFASNSIKHAFPGGRAGAVRFSLRFDETGALIIDLEDDGIGMDEGDGASGDGIGLAVIDASVAQLGATWESMGSEDKGTKARLVIPAQEG